MGIKVFIEGNLGKIEVKYVVIYAIFWGKKNTNNSDRVKFVTNSMSGTDHVISGPMRGIKIVYMGKGQHTT